MTKKFRSYKGNVSELEHVGNNSRLVNTSVWVDMESGEPMNIEDRDLNDKYEFHDTKVQAQAQAVRWHETQSSIYRNKINQNA